MHPGRTWYHSVPLIFWRSAWVWKNNKPSSMIVDFWFLFFLSLCIPAPKSALSFQPYSGFHEKGKVKRHSWQASCGAHSFPEDLEASLERDESHTLTSLAHSSQSAPSAELSLWTHGSPGSATIDQAERYCQHLNFLALSILSPPTIQLLPGGPLPTALSLGSHCCLNSLPFRSRHGKSPLLLLALGCYTTPWRVHISPILSEESLY